MRGDGVRGTHGQDAGFRDDPGSGGMDGGK